MPQKRPFVGQYFPYCFSLPVFSSSLQQIRAGMFLKTDISIKKLVVPALLLILNI